MASSDRETDEVIGENVRRLRGGLSQEGLAAAMRSAGHSWSQATVWSVETGRRAVRLAEARNLADVLGVTVEELIAMPHEVQRLQEVQHAVNVLSSTLYNIRRGAEQVERDVEILRRTLQRLREQGSNPEVTQLSQAYVADGTEMTEALSAVLELVRRKRTDGRYWAVIPEPEDG